MTSMNRTLETRLAEAVARKVSTSVSFLRWVRNEKTGADAPVFGVPAPLVSHATMLGFDAWQFEHLEPRQPLTPAL